VRPVYAPALVAWVGGPSFSLSVSFGGGAAGVAWFPLGPREVYVPAYRSSPAYINRVNVTNTTIVNNINITNINTTNVRYVNREAPGAVTAVPQSALASARPVQGAAVVVPPNALRSAQVVNNAPVAPSRQSVMGVAGAGRVAQPPAAVQSRAVFAKTAPPPAPVPFAQRQQALAANPGRPLDASQVQQLRGTQTPPARPFVRPVQGGTRGGFAQAPAQPAAPVAPRSPGDQTRPRDYPSNPSGNAPFGRPQRDAQPPASQPPASQPPSRDYPPNRQAPASPQTPSGNAPFGRPQRDAQPPASQPPANQPPPRDYPSNRQAPPSPQTPSGNAPFGRPQRDAQPPASQPPASQPPPRDARPNRGAAPENSPAPPRPEPPAPARVQPQAQPAREAQPQRGSDRPHGDARKEEKKDDKK